MTLQQELLITMRMMAWERAKGELRSMLQTFVHEKEDVEFPSETFKKQLELIKKFIKEYEDNYA